MFVFGFFFFFFLFGVLLLGCLCCTFFLLIYKKKCSKHKEINLQKLPSNRATPTRGQRPNYKAIKKTQTKIETLMPQLLKNS
jgi:hypothetical protein